MSFDNNKLKETEATEEQVENTSESVGEPAEVVPEPINEPAETAPESSEELTDLEKELFADMENSADEMTFTATLHFEFSDIFNAIEHIDPEPEAETEAAPEESEELIEPEATEEPEVEEPETVEEPTQEEALEEPAPEEVVEEDVFEELATEESLEEPIEPEVEPETQEPEAESEPDEPEEPEVQEEPEVEPEPESEVQEPTPEEPKKSREGILSKYKRQDGKTKKLVLTDVILFAVVAISIIGGLIAANSLVKESNAATEQKIAEMQANVKEINLGEGLYDLAADQVIEDIAVPTYSLDELYALDLREPTGFTATDLEMITRKGLVGCEEAFVEAEETYGVNCIFLMSIASLESAYGTQMFRPNNMFGYGRTGFSSKQEGIMTVAKGLGTRYLNPGGSLYGGSPTLKGVNKRYAANPQWYYKVGKYMQGYYAELAAAKNGALDKFE